MIALIRAIHDAMKPLAAIYHAPWLLIEADLLRGRRAASYKSIRKDVENAGASWMDEKVVADGGIITSRNPVDLNAFCDRIAEELIEGRQRDRAVA